MSGEPISELFSVAVEYALSKGARDLSKLPEPWVGKVNDSLVIAISGGDGQRTKPDGCMNVELDSYELAVWYNGWLAGILDPRGGTIAAGEACNEDTVIAMLKEATGKTETCHG